MPNRGLTTQQRTKLRMRLQQVFEPFRIHGLDVFIPPAIEAAISIMEQTLREPDKEDANGE